jgi:hypothetical protein
MMSYLIAQISLLNMGVPEARSISGTIVFYTYSTDDGIIHSGSGGSQGVFGTFMSPKSL